MQWLRYMAATAPSLVPKKKSQSLVLVVGALLLAAAGAGYWFYSTHLHPPATGSAASSNKPVESDSSVDAVTLDPFLANLSGGQGYVKVTITLSVHKTATAIATPKNKAESGAALLQSALVRDTILNDLSTQTAAVLLTPEGKAALKTELRSDLIAKVPNLSLDTLYFTDFLVQQ
jgi:flagellar basal body-associated protein FliL